MPDRDTRCTVQQLLKGGAQNVRVGDALLALERSRARKARVMWAGALVIAAGAVMTVFQSCSGGGRLADADQASGRRPLFEPLKVPQDGPDSKAGRANAGLDQSARDLEALFQKMKDQEESAATSEADSNSASADAGSVRDLSPRPARPERRAPVAETTSVAAAGDELVGPPVPAGLAAWSVEPATGTESSTVTAADRKADLATELAALLRPTRVDGSDRLGAIAPLLALEVVQPGAATPEIEAAIRSLTPEEASTVAEIRSLLHTLGSRPELAADPRAMAAELGRRLDALNTHAGSHMLSLGTVALCSRVESFGRYTPLSSARLIAGRVNSAILYVEVENFVQVPASEAPAAIGPATRAGDGYVVQLSQEVDLWYDDGTRQWTAPASVVRDSSRTRRHDFFLVQRIDLPANLSVGKYTLKVTVRDAGADGSPQVQAMLPIEVIADPRLATGGPKAVRPDPAASTAPVPARPRIEDRPLVSAPETPS